MLPGGVRTDSGRSARSPAQRPCIFMQLGRGARSSCLPLRRPRGHHARVVRAGSAFSGLCGSLHNSPVTTTLSSEEDQPCRYHAARGTHPPPALPLHPGRECRCPSQVRPRLVGDRVERSGNPSGQWSDAGDDGQGRRTRLQVPPGRHRPGPVGPFHRRKLRAHLHRSQGRHRPAGAGHQDAAQRWAAHRRLVRGLRAGAVGATAGSRAPSASPNC